jgi:hypothetical protein
LRCKRAGENSLQVRASCGANELEKTAYKFERKEKGDTLTSQQFLKTEGAIEETNHMKEL